MGQYLSISYVDASEHQGFAGDISSRRPQVSSYQQRAESRSRKHTEVLSVPKPGRDGFSLGLRGTPDAV